MSNSAVDFIDSAGADFTQSLALDRNVGSVSTRQWLMVGQSVSVTLSRGAGLGSFTIPAGYSLSDMRQVTIIPENTPSKFWRRQDFPGRESKQIARFRGFGGDGIRGQPQARQMVIGKTGSPIVRLFFRVRGVCDMVGWGSFEDLVIDQTTPINSQMGTMLSLTSEDFRLVNGGYPIEIKDYSGGPSSRFVFDAGLVLNRTTEPSALAIPGCFYLDRIVAVSAVVGDRDTFVATFAGTRTLQFDVAYNFFNPGSPDNGDYAGGLFTTPPGGSTSVFSPANGYTTTWGNPRATNPPALSRNLAHGTTLMPPEGFAHPSGIGTVPVEFTNAMEVVFIGARAENEIRAEETIDIRAPELLNEF